ncbi:hypothetical protein [Rhizohabitans arisaemae]|uniref:hypothetical protein n=1 Tax=Rhizohabitans arisaemae TaxID=2720610 RepID=UPI0024B089F7|nr:hypothetical protein [Rhizohabitans arisaemae]
MDPDTFRSGVEVEGPETYWRRRAVALIVVLVVVAVIAWACSGSSEERSPSSAGSSALPTPVALDPAAVAAAPTPVPTVTVTTVAKPTAAPSPAAKAPGDVCDPKNVVVSLIGSGTTYPDGMLPRFILTVVNTGEQACSMDVGPRAVELLITSGRDRIWSSADCVSGEGASLRKFARGVPYVRVVDWDRRRSAQDCRRERAEALPGTYVAVVRAGQHRTGKSVFLLR